MGKVILISNRESSRHLIQHSRKLFILGTISFCILFIFIIGKRNSVPNRSAHQMNLKTFLDQENDKLPEKSVIDSLENVSIDQISSDQQNHEAYSDLRTYEYDVSKPETKIGEQKSEIDKTSSGIEIKQLQDSNDEFPDPNYNEMQLAKIREVRQCYTLKESDHNVQLFDDIEKFPPKPDKSIFFIDSTCLKSTRVDLNARQACAIESAAKLNPNRDVYILYLSPVGFPRDKPDTPIITALRSYKNIHFRNVNIYKYSQNTPAEQWIKQDRIFTSENFVVHLSDYLRFVTLYKFGGIYEDLDFINIKTFNNLPPNFAADQNDEYINNSAIGFASKGFGHTFIEKILRECFEEYDPNEWDYNGPMAIQRAIQKICKTTELVDMMRNDFCGDFKITPQAVFFPLKPFFEAFETNSELVANTKSQITNETVAIHLWSSRTARISILKETDTSIYLSLAKKYCSKSFEASGPYFD